MRKQFYSLNGLGEICLAEESGKLTHLWFHKEQVADDGVIEETDFLKQAAAQIEEYLHGYRKVFQLPLNPYGTKFQKEVWQALLTIPYGQTRSYKEVAEMVGNPKAVRAVGMANNRNPIPILIPCHRVIGSNGQLVGYGGGLEIKQLLLSLEKKQEK